MSFGLGLCLLSFAVVLFPEPFILRRFQKQYGSPWGKESFQAFQFFDIAWMIVCMIGLGWSQFRTNDVSDLFALLAIFLALITMPMALYAGFTGIYPQRSRMGYCYFQQYKDPAKQFLMSSKYPELKIVGWVQFIFLMGIVGVSASYLFW